MCIPSITTTLRKLPVFQRTSWKVFAIVGVLVLLMLAGFVYFTRPSVTGATVVLDIPHANTHVFLDNSRLLGITHEPDTSLSVNVPTDTHVITVVRNNHWPWVYVHEFNRGDTHNLQPFLLPKNITPRVIAPESQTYNKITQAIHGKRGAPTANDPLTSPDGSTHAWVNGSTIYLGRSTTSAALPDIFCEKNTCTSEVVLSERTHPVRELAYYKNRNDVLIFEEADTIYTIGAHGINLQRLYKGSAQTPPHMHTVGTSTIYVLNDDTLFHMNL